MRKRWMRRLAMTLAMCLLLNNCISEMPMLVHATEDRQAVISVSEGNAVVISEEALQETVEGEETELTEGENQDADVVESTETAEGQTQDTIESELAEVTEETSKDNEATDTLQEENSQDISLTATGTETNMPTTADEYTNAVNSGITTFYINNYERFLAMQNLCAIAEGYKDITLIIASPSEEVDTWNIDSLEGFSGIGTQEYPFRGTLYCAYDEVEGGVTLKLDTALFGYLGDGAEVYNLNMVSNGGNAVIAENISGAVTISDIIFEAGVSNANGAAGVIAANIADNSNVTIANVRSKGAVTVNGAIAGGIAGTVGTGVTVTLGDKVALGSEGSEIVVTGTDAVGGYYGVVTGNIEWNLADEDRLFARAVGNNADCYAGQFAGKLISPEGGTAQLNITGGSSVTVNVSGTGNGGGFLGLCGSGATISKPDGTFTVSGSISTGWVDASRTSRGNVGGLIGVLEDTSMIFSDYVLNINHSAINGMKAGGIVGEIRGGKYIVKNIEIANGFWAHNVIGGIAGSVVDSAAIEIQGKLTFGTQLTANQQGAVVGGQDKSLIYFSEINGIIDGDSQLSSKNENEIGTYGGVYRNQVIDENTKLIGDGTLENVGVIHNEIANVDGDFQLDSASDFVTLAIALGTNGVYGMTNAAGENVFEGVSAPDYATLLESSYDVTANVDISYDKTGIVTINRNDVEDETYAFAGSMQGVGTGITITQNISVKQERVGVFSTLAGDVTFENLTFAGTISKAIDVGGIAYQSIGSGLTLKNITMNRIITGNGNSDIIGGVLAQVDGEDDFALNVDILTLASTIEAGGVNTSSGFITTMSNAQISMKNIVLGGKFSCTSGSQTGGFLCRKWEKIGGKIENVTVQGSGAVYKASGKFGALMGTVTSSKGERLILQEVALDGLTVTDTSDSGKSNCALLVQNAEKLILEVIDYDSSGCKVNNPGKYFDEIAGQSKTYIDFSAPTGIISIHNSEKAYPEYHYVNQAEGLEGATNGYTMYFYDVFQLLEKESGTVKIGSDCILDSVEKVLIWDLIHYASYEESSTVRDTILEYTDIEDYNLYYETCYFKGTLDLSKISFYPVYRAAGFYYGVNNAVIKFDASVYNMKTWTLSNIDEGSQHYALQAGLFYDPSAFRTFENITLTGKVANLGTKSGALVSGSKGLRRGSLKNVTADNLWILDYAGEAEVGLLISKIPGSTVTKEEEGDDTKPYAVTFDGVTMTNYSLISTTKAAAALIGSAGGKDVVDLTLEFSNMVIADDVDGKSSGSHNGDVLAYASFIYSYTYTDDAGINEGYGLYLFTEADCKATNPKNVTYGVEIDDDTEFADNSKKVVATMGIDPEAYKPYVYEIKKIEVNPKSGNVLKGCGTYEDPYIIETPNQFLTLYRYINETGTEGNYQYQTFYKNWMIIEPGDDAEFCSTKHSVQLNEDGTLPDEGGEDVRTFGEESFPTPDDLSRAYYRLGANIDLNEVTGTYEQIAKDFVGFGTEERPFVGVWYGKGTDETGKEITYTITLPDKPADASYSTYGLIQYARGTVVKDINIKANARTSEDVTPTKIEAIGGGVIACILGGDNIIDGVTVDAEYMVADASAIIGGYVGNVKKGGLILRNISDTALANFTLDSTTATSKLIGAIAGKVEDGYVVYESGASDACLWNGTGGSSYSQIPNYNVLNITALEAADGEITPTKADDVISFSIPSAADLQLMSMAMNADVLNVRPSDYDNYTACGYTENSRCRKADYSAIGCTTAVADYVAAAKYDNVMSYNTAADTAYAYPYLYDYIGIKENFADYLVVDSGKGYSILNPAESIASKDYHIEWKLTGSAYDMSKFGKSFKGIGALYQTGDGYGGTFHGDFDGNGSIITLAILRHPAKGDGTTVCRAGLFNTLYGAEAAYEETADFAKPGEAANYVECFVIENFTLLGSIKQSTDLSAKEVCAGCVVACIENGNFSFNGINCKDLNIATISRVGGMIGIVSNSNSYIHINDCDVDKMTIKCLYSAAGFVSSSQAKVLKIVASTVENLNITPWNDNDLYRSGGLVGEQKNADGLIILDGLKDVAEKQIKVTNSTMDGRWDAGGLVSYTNSELVIVDAYCEANTLIAYNHMGGIVGEIGAGNSGNAGLIQSVAVKDIVADEYNLFNGATNGIGGIVGRNNSSLTIEDVTISDTGREDGHQFRLNAYTNKTRTGSLGMGGIVGVHSKGTLTLKNCSVDGISIVADTHYSDDSGSTVRLGAGGLVGYVDNTVVLDGTIMTTNLSVVAPLREEANRTVLSAGGCFGYVNSNVTGVSGGNYVGLHASHNTVSAKQAGGLVGYVNTGANIRLAKILVQSGTVTSDECAGGVFGHMTTSWSGCALDKTDTGITNTIQDMKISGRFAGGVIGNMEIAGSLRMESLLLYDNKIVASQTVDGGEYSAGGVIGACSSIGNSDVKIHDVTLEKNIIICEVQTNTLSSTEIDKFAVGGLIGAMSENDNSNVGDILCDNPVINSDNKIGVQVAGYEDAEEVGDISTVKLVYYNGNCYQLSNISAPGTDGESMDYEVQQELVQECGCFVGTMVGAVKSDNTQLYVLRSEDTNNKFVTPVIAVNPPVTDVGRTTNQLADDYRQYCHIIYGAENSIANVANTISGSDAESNLTDMKAAFEEINSTYNGTEGLTGLLQEYRLSEDELALFEQVYHDNYTFSEGMTIDFPILVYKAEYGTLQEVMECIVNIMTNVAGASASDIDGDYLTITCKRKLCIGDTVMSGENEASSITAVSKNGVTTYSSPRYDGIVEIATAKEQYLSYTELTFTYGWSEHKKVFKLPIFVEEPILYNVHMMLMEGRVSDVDTIKEKGISEFITDSETGTESVNQIIMANDSDYTMLLEYTYGKARKNMPDDTCVEKVFSLEAGGKAKSIAVGTRLMLIDVTNGNKVYYYTVESSDISWVKFSDFKDSTGVAYVNQSINKLVTDEVDEGKDYYTDLADHQLKDVGVERFLLSVLATENADNMVYSIHNGIQIENEGLASRFDTMEGHAEEAVINVKAVPGLEISFVERGTGTDIEGTISKEGGLTIKGCIELKAKSYLYWSEKSSAANGTPMIDSSNNGKYLELAFYLRDKSNNRVRFPSGTNFSYKIGTENDETVYSAKTVIPNDSVVYYYKDIREAFEIVGFEYQISSLTEDTTVPVEFLLDFTGADMANITEETYSAWLDLYRTANKDYPMGNNNKLDSYTEDVKANASQQLGFAIRAQKLEQLAINTYPEAEEANCIDYNVMFDFGDILKQTSGAGVDALVEKWTGFDYTVTYQVYQKVPSEDSVVYEAYTGKDIVLSATGGVVKNAETGLYMAVESESDSGRMEVLYQFTAEQLNADDGFISFPDNTVTINTKALTEEMAGDLTNLTNYKIVATLTITERGTTTQPTKETTDFFIYTIAKLKTDL